MPEHALQPLIDAVGPVEIRENRETSVHGICYDSRAVRPGSIFVAIPGVHTDGHRFVQEAADRGACAIIHSSRLDNHPAGPTLVRVADSRIALAQISNLFYGRPAESLILIGVTGTDGKSSTVSYIYQLLRRLGERVGFFSTVAMDTGSGLQKNRLRQSTPESPEIHRALFDMVSAGCRYAVIETTSHGLSARTARLHGLRFDAAVFTNLSHEHLEFHGSFEQYRNDKMNLFRALKRDDTSFGVVNSGDPNCPWFAEAADRPVFAYRVAEPAETPADTTPHEDILIDGDRVGIPLALKASRCRFSADSTECRLTADDRSTVDIRIPMPAPFNVENVLAAALTVARILRIPVSTVAKEIGTLEPVVGRMAPVTGSQPFTVLVDYAHSPGSFEKVFPIFRRNTPGRLIAVFGSAGERDVQKRPIQGSIAARYADVLILADEDPRGEDPMSILEQIAEGARRQNPSLIENETLYLIPNRTRAIHTALSIATAGDTVVMLGKGHEANIICHKTAIDWDEKRVAEQQLELLGYTIGNRPTTKER